MKFVDFIVEHWDALAGILMTIVSLISTVVIAIKNKQWNKISKFVKGCVTKAEEFKHYTGEEKKAYVMTLANQYAIEKGIKFNTTKVSNLIEDVVKLSKEVNARDKDKNAAK